MKRRKKNQKPIRSMEEFRKRFYPKAEKEPEPKILIVIPRPGV